VKDFFKKESAGGFVLIAASALGLMWANSPLAHEYEDLLHAKIGITSDLYSIHLTTHAWINDALMAIFFFLVGLEIRREIAKGELSSLRTAALPAIAAVGGMLVPALICAAFVWSAPGRGEGWAIPAATDIAFALAALALVGKSLPPALKVFLTALAVIDDLGAIVVIAVFYTPNLVLPALYAALCGIAILVALNRLKVTAMFPYIIVGIAVWFCVFESGVHATLAGVALSFTIPMAKLERVEHGLHPYVAFGIMPLFGLFNAGVSFAGISPAILLGPLPLGIAAGLFVGKQLGIFGFSWLAVKLARVAKPRGVTWPMLYGVALLGGIGFTMSLFIGTLAFSSDALLTETKIGVFLGSALSALCGCLVLAATAKRRKPLSA
jgi:NhaA family Na+:H+ antiporter